MACYQMKDDGLIGVDPSYSFINLISYPSLSKAL